MNKLDSNRITRSWAMHTSNSNVLTCSYEAVDEMSSTQSLLIEFNMIKAATENFSTANKLGEGGFGAVYKVMIHYEWKSISSLIRCMLNLKL